MPISTYAAVRETDSAFFPRGVARRYGLSKRRPVPPMTDAKIWPYPGFVANGCSSARAGGASAVTKSAPNSAPRAITRDRPGAIATKYDRCVKGGQILQRVLKESRDAELLILATWNDLGEGMGVGRNYDYYVDGRWLPPHYFMQLIRNSQQDGNGHR